MNQKMLYCPKCGKKTFVFNRKKSFVCQDCGFEYFHNVASAVGVIIEYQGRLLLTRRKIEPKRGTLDLPGGFVDYHESGEDCVRREIKEELNLNLKELEFFCSAPNTYEYKGVVYQTLDLIYISKIKTIKGIQARDDIDDYKFLLPSELDINELAFDSSKYGLAKYLRTKV